MPIASTASTVRRESTPVCPVSSFNEWDTLEEVIVGRVDGSVVPPFDTVVRTNTYPHNAWFYERHGGQPFPEEMITAAAKELEEFCRVLEGEGVVVRRPDPVDYHQPFKTPDFESVGMYGAMPRDILIVFGDEIVEAPMAWRSRFFEYRAYRTILKDYFNRGARWTTVPKPLMSDKLYRSEFHDMPMDERERLAEQGIFVTTEFEPCFDAADFFRCGRDIFVQRSHVTNLMGIRWVQRHLGDRFRIHLVRCQDTNPMHIDASMVPLREGLIMTNPLRPCDQIDLFKNAGWDVIEAPYPTVPDDWPLYMASKWLSTNILILGPKRVVLEKDEEPMHRLFRSLGFEVIPVAFRHVYPFGGSFHCVTCDVRRTGELKSYGFAEPEPLLNAS